MFQAFAPHIMPLTVEEGIANGISEARKAVRYQIKHGAKLIKVCASGGVMSHTGPAGAQQYSDEELRAIADEAHRAGHELGAVLDLVADRLAHLRHAVGDALLVRVGQDVRRELMEHSRVYVAV